MEDLESRYLEVMVRPEHLAAGPGPPADPRAPAARPPHPPVRPCRSPAARRLRRSAQAEPRRRRRRGRGTGRCGANCGRGTGRCGANCGRTARSTSRPGRRRRHALRLLDPGDHIAPPPAGAVGPRPGEAAIRARHALQHRREPGHHRRVHGRSVLLRRRAARRAPRSCAVGLADVEHLRAPGLHLAGLLPGRRESDAQGEGRRMGRGDGQRHDQPFGRLLPADRLLAAE